MAVLYWKPCYNEARYNEVGLYLFSFLRLNFTLFQYYPTSNKYRKIVLNI